MSHDRPQEGMTPGIPIYLDMVQHTAGRFVDTVPPKVRMVALKCRPDLRSYGTLGTSGHLHG